MGDIQPLNYNPMQTGLQAMQLLQMQQHLGLQQQGQAMQQQNMAVDNARQAYQAANPMESYPAYANYAKLSGLPVPDVNSYYANPNMYDKLLNAEPGTHAHAQAMETWLKTNPGSRAVVEGAVKNLRVFRGAQELNVKAGLGGSENLAEFTADKPAMQTQVGNAVAQSELQQEKAAALKQKMEEHNNFSTYANAQIGALLPIAKSAGLAIDRAAPHVAALSTIQQEYDKQAKSVGITKAAEMRREKILTNPDLQSFSDRRMQSIPQMQQQVQQIEDLQSQLQTRAELIANGVQPLQEGESIHLLAGKIDASVQHLAYAKATLAFAKDPTPANLDGLKAVKDGMDTHLAGLSEKKNASQASLDIRRDSLNETAEEHRLTRQRTDNIGKAQVAWMEAGGDIKTAHTFAKQFNVKVSEVTDAAKDPNNPGVVVKMPSTTEEAGKFSMIDNAVKNIDAVMSAITKPDGSIDRQKVFNAALNIPFTEGRELNSMMEDAISAKLRAETGAAANAEEVKSISRRFNLSTLDKDDVIKSKLSRLRRFLNETRVIRDSGGKIRESAAKGEQAKETAAPQAAPQAVAPSGSVAPFNDADKEARYQEFKRNHK